MAIEFVTDGWRFISFITFIFCVLGVLFVDFIDVALAERWKGLEVASGTKRYREDTCTKIFLGILAIYSPKIASTGVAL